VTATEPRAPIGFATDIKPLFRAKDRDSMTFAFDLWNVNDVRSHADAIYDRLQEGTMPCDGGWPDDKIDLFRRWIATGKAD